MRTDIGAVTLGEQRPGSIRALSSARRSANCTRRWACERGLVVIAHRRSGRNRKVLGVKGIGARAGCALPGHRGDVPDRDAGGAARRESTWPMPRRSRRPPTVQLSVGYDPDCGPCLPCRRGCFGRDPRRRGDRRGVGGVGGSGGACPAGRRCSGRWPPGPGSVVVEGRDIGTVVLPDADVKIFLTASAEDPRAAAQRPEHRGRAGRRLRGRAGRRAPPRPPGLDPCGVAAARRRDAVVVDTSDMTEAEVIAHLLELVEQRSGAAAMSRSDGTWSDESDWELADRGRR